MKSLITAGIFLGLIVTLSACTTLTPDEEAAMRIESGAAPPQSATTQSSQTTASNSTSGKTRAQVYQELVNSEKSGEMEYLNSTLYSH
jgi:hypothetical protein